MKCHGCNSQMILDKQESGAGSHTQWHSCPLCRKVRLTSRPVTNNLIDHPIDKNNSHIDSYDDRHAGNDQLLRKGTPYFA